MSLNAYIRTAQAAESPQQVEERALQFANRKLLAAAEQGTRGAALVEALHFNRELWRTFADDCSVQGNGLPPEIRAAIISLNLWVQRFSSDVAAGRDTVDSLVEVNSNIMEGLAAQRQPR